MIKLVISSFNSFVSLSVAILLGGCVSLLPDSSQHPRYHELKISSVSPDISSNVSLSIEEPTSALIFNGKNIVVEKRSKSDDIYFSYIKANQWSENLPLMLQRYLTRSLRSPHWNKVFAGYSTSNIEFTLKTEIIEFTVIDPDQISVKLYATLLDNKNHTVVSAREFNEKLTTPPTISGFMIGFNTAMDKVFSQLQGWIKKEVKTL